MANIAKEEKEPLQCKPVSLCLCVSTRDLATNFSSFILAPRIVPAHLTKRN